MKTYGGMKVFLHTFMKLDYDGLFAFQPLHMDETLCCPPSRSGLRYLVLSSSFVCLCPPYCVPGRFRSCLPGNRFGVYYENIFQLIHWLLGYIVCKHTEQQKHRINTLLNIAGRVDSWKNQEMCAEF
jgi:hypothetical protein